MQAGIDSSVTGDVVLVGPGTYYESIDYNGKEITVRSEQGPEVTILDGSHGTESVVMFHNAEGRGAILEGFTITGGKGTGDPTALRGGGIICTNASPVIRRNHILQNGFSSTTSGSGGGIAIGTGYVETPTPSPLIEENLIASNVARRNGGGVDIRHAEATVHRNVFRENTCGYDGGGVFGLFGLGRVEIEGNQFWENSAGDHGGGVYLADTYAAEDMVVRGNLFVRNRAQGIGAGDSGSGGAIWVFVISGEISTNTLVGNIGRGESACSGGGIVLDGTPADLDVHGNLIAANDGCGIACKDQIRTVLGPNLLWQNNEGDLGTGSGRCPESWQANLIIVDPQFCGPDHDNFTVAKDSPALTGSEVMGVFREPGCGPGVPVRSTTWGRIKVMFR